MNFLKHIYIFGLLLSIATMPGCTTEETALMTIERQVDFEIPAGLNTIETHTFVIQNVPLGFATEIESRGYNVNSVKRILAEKGLVVAKFDNIDWDFVNEVSIRALSNTIPVENVEIFYQDPVPFNTNEEIKLFSNITNVKDILLSNVISLEIKMRFRQISPTNIDTRLTMSFALFETE